MTATNIWLRSFYGFSPEQDGYIGWTREEGRNHVMNKIAPGDLMLIYGAGASETPVAQRNRVIGFLQVDPVPIRDIDKASEAGLARKRENGWEGQWTHALPVRRAWRVDDPVLLESVAINTYRPKAGRAIAAWSAPLDADDIERVLDLRVTETSVYGEPAPNKAFIRRPLREAVAFARATDDPTGNFAEAFEHFRRLVLKESGHAFETFDDGLAGAWERYKPSLRAYALTLLDVDAWHAEHIGTGLILEATIKAVEINDRDRSLRNNLVFWRNQYGHANRDHKALLEARSSALHRSKIEEALYNLYRSEEDEPALFDHLADLTGAKYPLLAYLFFLKDMDRFMPIQPTGFDRAFGALGVNLKTLRNCSWENYAEFNATLDRLRGLIASVANLDEVKLVDAHSFCWIFSELLKKEGRGELGVTTSGASGSVRVLGARDRSIVEMRTSVENTVGSSNGQTVERQLKDKKLFMTASELEAFIKARLDLQENRCALSGIPFQFRTKGVDAALLPSLDRIDSNGHYAQDNLQIVCRFINFWKSDSDNEEFKRLLAVVREQVNSDN